MGGSRARMGGSRARMGGSRARMGGSRARMGGSRARMGGSLPRMGCTLPRMGGSLPRMGGSLPRMRCTLPRMGCSLPRMGCTLPRMVLLQARHRFAIRRGSPAALAGITWGFLALYRRGTVRLALLLVLGCITCTSAREADSPGHVDRAFYYWRTTFALSATERDALADLHVSRLYVRVFDVGWDDGDKRAKIRGPIAVTQPPPASVDVVPVVFVTTEVLRHAQAAPLAQQVWTALQDRIAALHVTPHELQLDCDWTDTTQTAYFDFLRALHDASGLTLTATIRLHQVKYRERTGVPPVARGTLMFYNMGKFSADPDARAIFDADAASHYLSRIDGYPLPLDVALPIWSWVVHVRDDAVVGLLQSTDPSELDGIDFLAPTGDGRYRATRSTFFHGTFLRDGDVLKVEVTGPDDTQAAADLLAPHLSATSRTVTLFDLSERNLARHDLASLDRAFRTLP
jgi:hypothetical protein